MLNTLQKFQILKRAGHTVPSMPTGASATPAVLQQWAHEVENLYVSYVASRAARSLREAEEVRQLERLRRLASRAYAA